MGGIEGPAARILAGLGLAGLAWALWTRVQTRKDIHRLALQAREAAQGRPHTLQARGALAELARTLGELGESLKVRLAEIEKETAHLDAILSNMSEGVISLDGDGRLTSLNPSAQGLFGLDPAFAKGRTLLETIRNGTLDDLARSVLKSGESRYQEIAFFLPQESVFQVHAGPLKIEGKVKGALLVLHDITELKRLEKHRRDFVANVSHELRTPLSSIQGFAETLLDGGLKDTAHNREFVETIHAHAARLRRLIDDLLDLSAIESGQRTPAKQPADLSRLIEEVAKILAPSAKCRNVSVKLTLPSALHAELDAEQMRQAIINLLDNAIKFNREGGHVEIVARDFNGALEVSVRDTGIGIPTQDLPRIFERFYRVDKARSRELGGTGLGLAIVKHIVEAHGGSVGVESAEGKGSTFRLTLPK